MCPRCKKWLVVETGLTGPSREAERRKKKYQKSNLHLPEREGEGGLEGRRPTEIKNRRSGRGGGGLMESHREKPRCAMGLESVIITFNFSGSLQRCLPATFSLSGIVARERRASYIGAAFPRRPALSSLAASWLRDCRS